MRYKFLSLICFIYSFIIIYVYLTNKLNNYLAPNMQLYIIISCPIFIIIGVILLFNKTKSKFLFSDLFLIIPLIIIFLSGDGNLTTNIASNRTINFSKVGVVKKKNVDNNKEVINKDETDYSKIYFDKVDFDVVDKAYSVLADSLTFNSKPENLVGKTIRVKGFALLDDELVPKGYFGIGKYVISCCAADAGFGGFIARYDKPNEIKKDKWYQVEGVFEIAYDVYGNKIAAIHVVNLKSIKSDSERHYVYPCYSYDDKCSVLDNYDFEY